MPRSSNSRKTWRSESVLGTSARLFYRECLMRWLGQGNEKIVVGRDGFLFFLQEVEMAAGPGFLRRRSTRQRGIDEPATRVSTDARGRSSTSSVSFETRAFILYSYPFP